MQKRRFLQLPLQLAILAGSFMLPCAQTLSHASGNEKSFTAPEFTHTGSQDWINSAPLKMADLRGKVVLLDFWTFGCWNCYRSFPWLNGVRDQFAGQAFQVVGVHTPETDSERERADIIANAKKHGVTNPVMIDNDFSYWKAMSNHYWPTFYLIDKHGKVRAQFIGETHQGDQNAVAIDSMIKKLMAEN
jgi:thiol-disulfide isomerase/thioredoxin